MPSSSSPLGARYGIGKTSLFGVLIAALCLAALAVSATGASAATSKWTNGTVPLPSGGTEGKLQAIDCPGSATCIAVGVSNSFTQPLLAEHWNGTAWSVKTVPLPNQYLDSGSLNGISCTSTSNCTAVGSYRNAFVKERAYAMRWNGTSWSIVTVADIAGTPEAEVHSALSSISCVSTTCVAVGSYRIKSGPKQAWASIYNGTTWTAYNLGQVEGLTTTLNGVSCQSSTNCTAVGALQENWKGLTVQWTGGKWSALKPLESVSRLTGISCLSTSCEAVGNKLESSVKVPAAVRWNGTEWASQSVPAPGGATSSELKGVDCSSSLAIPCWASGNYTASGVSTPLAENFESSTWSVDLPNSIAGATEQTLPGIASYLSNKAMAVGSYRSGGKSLPMAQSVIRE